MYGVTYEERAHIAEAKVERLTVERDEWKDKYLQLTAQTCRAEDEVERLTAALQASESAAAPKGWKLVPIEPTSIMRDKACSAWLDCGSKLVLNKALSAIRAGIEAAPQPPVSAKPTTVEQATVTLINALRESKGWTTGYANAVVRDAVDRVPARTAP